MTEKHGVLSKTWHTLRRTASGLGSTKSFEYVADDKPSGSPKAHPTSNYPLRPVKNGAVPVQNGAGPAQNGTGPTQNGTGPTQNGTRPIQDGAGPSTPHEAGFDSFSSPANHNKAGHPVGAHGSRAEFLRAYDAATLELCNRLSNGNAVNVAETAMPEMASWNRVSGYLGYLDKFQEQKLQQMRAWIPESTRWHTDHDVLRFLRAREFDLTKAKEMYSHYINEYRGRQMISPNPAVRPSKGPFQVELVELYPERDPALTARMEKLMQWFLHTVAFGVDKADRPVVYFRPADIVKQNMMKHVPVEDRIAFQSSANEMLLILTKMASQRAGLHIENITQVLDLQGMSAMQMISHMRSPGAQREWQHNMDFMPEVLHKIYIINAPTGMPMVWKVACYFTPKATAQKVEVLGSSYQAELTRAIGKENMPSCYGGDCSFEWPQHRPIKELQY